MTRRVFRCILLSAIVGVSCLSRTAASERARAPESTHDRGEAGPDFLIQGEYIGSLESGGEAQMFGVQVIARSGGTFDAVGYPGGLPGAGWHRSAKMQFQGKTEGSRTVLERKGGTGEAHRLVIESRRMKVLDGSGAEAGRLERVIRKSPTVGQKPAEGALVLFDGKSGEHFRQARGGNSPPVSEDGLLRLVRGSGGLFTRKDFGSCRLHLEFRLPFEPAHSGQGRSNSGCYLQSRYEVQILDSFGLEGLHNECGGIYSSGAHPSVNMCFPPLSWQTYDIDFTAAQFDSAGKKIADARMTVLHNGVEVYTDQKIGHITTAAPEEGKPETADLKPHYLQDHGHELHFRNIWIVER